MKLEFEIILTPPSKTTIKERKTGKGIVNIQWNSGM
jgi:hypothetical protein